MRISTYKIGCSLLSRLAGHMPVKSGEADEPLNYRSQCNTDPDDMYAHQL